MVRQVLTALEPRAGGIYVDGTVGAGGHAEAILLASGPDGHLYGCDRDSAAVAAARGRLARFGGRVELRQGAFGELQQWVKKESCDGVLLDLGVSSPQLDSPERGFSFQQDGPLDMRMDNRQSMTAAQLLNQASPEELARIFWEFGGERNSRTIARAIERERQAAPILTTLQLAQLVERIMPRRGGRVHPATRVFQGLRIAVNDEIEMVRSGLEAVWQLLKSRARLAVITFHSLEDRIVKEFGRARARDYVVPGGVDVPELRQAIAPQARWVSRKAIQPEADELRENPRSRSAQLRVLERI